MLKEREKQEKEKPAKLSFSIKNKTKEQDGVVSSEKKVFDHDSSGEDGNYLLNFICLQSSSYEYYIPMIH